MTFDQFSRSRLIYGAAGIEMLQKAHVAVFGIGGVGGYVAESLVRTGLGAITLVDSDTVELTNLNRQIIATHETLGTPKVDAMAQRLASINPAVHIECRRTFFLPETAGEFDFGEYDYVVDAIDTVTGKLQLIEQTKGAGTPIISAMGAGNKTDPTAIRIADVSKTSICPLARIMRRELRRRGIEGVKVAYSLEPPVKLEPPINPAAENEAEGPSAETPPAGHRSVPGSAAFVPPAMGLTIAAEVVRDLTRGLV